MRGSSLLLVAAALSLPAGGPALAQPASTPGTSPAASPAASPPNVAGSTAPDPVVAKVGDSEIHASDVSDATAGLPEQLRGMPPQMLYPMLLDQLIDRRALVMEAEKEKLQDNPAVEKQVSRARDTALQNALLSRDIAPTLTDAAIKARYEKDYANKPGAEEVNAAHILVPTEDKAKEIIKKLDAGADFATLAKENSTDPSAKGNAGDLGFFKKGDMLPEFSNAAFALKPGEITQTPVKTRFGYHVIKLIARKTAEPPKLEDVQAQIRQSLIQEGVAKALTEAKQGLTVVKYNQDGSPMAEQPAAGTPPAGGAPGEAPKQ